MAGPATTDDINALRSELKDSFEDVTALLCVFMQQVDDRFISVGLEQQKTRQEISKAFDYLDSLLKKHGISDDARLVTATSSIASINGHMNSPKKLATSCLLNR